MKDARMSLITWMTGLCSSVSRSQILREAAAWIRRGADRLEEGEFEEARKMIEVGIVGCAAPFFDACRLRDAAAQSLILQGD